MTAQFAIKHLLSCATLIVGAAFAGESDYQKDAERHKKETAANQSHVYKGEKTVRRFGQSREVLEEAGKHPAGKHFTTAVKGRPPSPETAKNNVGLDSKPKYMLTARAKDLRVEGKGHDKAVGGKHNMPEALVSKNYKDKLKDVRIEKLKNKEQKKSP